MGRDQLANIVLKLGLTTILLAYFLIWLPQPVVGLSFIGLEMGEWVKFIPAVQAGNVSADRNLFYLPPITLGLMLLLWSSNWPNRRWKTWALRGLAILVALLAFPAVESFLDETANEWLLRLIWVAIVVLLAFALPILTRLPEKLVWIGSWSLIAVLAFIGLVLPSWAYIAVRPFAADIIGAVVGFGPGFWLNGVAHLSILVVAIMKLRSES